VVDDVDAAGVDGWKRFGCLGPAAGFAGFLARSRAEPGEGVVLHDLHLGTQSGLGLGLEDGEVEVAVEGFRLRFLAALEPESEFFLGNAGGLGGDVREAAGADEGANVALVLRGEVDRFAGHGRVRVCVFYLEAYLFPGRTWARSSDQLLDELVLAGWTIRINDWIAVTKGQCVFVILAPGVDKCRWLKQGRGYPRISFAQIFQI